MNFKFSRSIFGSRAIRYGFIWLVLIFPMIGNAKADPILINASSFLNSIIFHYIKQSVLNEELNNLADHGKQICIAGGADGNYDRCRTVRSLGEGIQLADNSGVDLKWAWDAFKDQNGYVAWVCRGTNTRRFAEQSQCGQSEKADRIWPGP